LRNHPMNNLDNILKYWRTSVADADRMGIDYTTVRMSPQIPWAAIAGGRIPSTTAATIFSSQPTRQSGSKRSDLLRRAGCERHDRRGAQGDGRQAAREYLVIDSKLAIDTTSLQKEQSCTTSRP
jgi:hypothetical protein